jgi:hypothetical protein
MTEQYADDQAELPAYYKQLLDYQEGGFDAAERADYDTAIQIWTAILSDEESERPVDPKIILFPPRRRVIISKTVSGNCRRDPPAQRQTPPSARNKDRREIPTPPQNIARFLAEHISAAHVQEPGPPALRAGMPPSR